MEKPKLVKNKVVKLSKRPRNVEKTLKDSIAQSYTQDWDMVIIIARTKDRGFYVNASNAWTCDKVSLCEIAKDIFLKDIG